MSTVNSELYARKFEQFRAAGEDWATAAEWAQEAAECQGHPAGPSDPMGVEVYCDGSCRNWQPCCAAMNTTCCGHDELGDVEPWIAGFHVEIESPNFCNYYHAYRGPAPF